MDLASLAEIGSTLIFPSVGHWTMVMMEPTRRARRAKSVTMAPNILPFGPNLQYPIE